MKIRLNVFVQLGPAIGFCGSWSRVVTLFPGFLCINFGMNLLVFPIDCFFLFLEGIFS